VFPLEDLGNIPEPKQAFLDSGKARKGLMQLVFTKENAMEQLKKQDTDKSPEIDELHPNFNAKKLEKC